MNNYAPLQGTADNLARHGRYGDSMLVHMNPVEVEGIAALSPNGQLTINPVTGQPEAFLPFLLSMLANMGASSAAVGLIGPGTAAGLSSGVAGAIGSGLMTTALTGDPLQGLASAGTGYGLGKVGGAAFEKANPAVEEAAQKLSTLEGSLADTTEGIQALQGTKAASNAAIRAFDAMDEATANPAAYGAAKTAAEQAYTRQADLANLLDMKKDLIGQEIPIGDVSFGDYGPEIYQTGTEKIPGSIAGAETAYQDAIREAKFGPGRSLFTKEGAAAGFKQLIDPETLIPIAIGEGQRSEMEYEEEQRRLSGQTEEQKRQDYMRASGLLREAEQAYPGYPGYAGGGGIASVNPSNYSRRRLGFEELGNDPIRMYSGGLGSGYLQGLSQSARFGEGTSAERQFGLRGQMPITPEELAAITSSPGGRAGFGPEISYFPRSEVELPEDTDGDIPLSEDIPTSSDYNLSNIPNLRPEEVKELEMKEQVSQVLAPPIPQRWTPEQKAAWALNRWSPGAMPGPSYTPPQLPSSWSGSYGKLKFDPSRFAGYRASPIQMQNVGQVPSVSGPSSVMPLIGQPTMAESLPMGPPTMAPSQPMVPSDNQAMDQLIDQTEMAILGELPPEQAEIVITQFIDVFGEEAFQRLREQTLQAVEPGAQTQGIIQGPGGGMDDLIGGSIMNGASPARVAVSQGEFIVPADVVSGLGDGSSDAGADKLDAMMNQVRMAKTGGIIQPKRISNTVLPV